MQSTLQDEIRAIQHGAEDLADLGRSRHKHRAHLPTFGAIGMQRIGAERTIVGFPVRHGANFMRRPALILGLAVVAITQVLTTPAVRADFTTNPQTFSIPLTP